MTSHRLVRCGLDRLLGHAARLHPTGGQNPGPVPRWRYTEPPPDRSTCWRTRLPDGSVLGWCLEVEPGANGVLAHLSVAPVAGGLTRLPVAVQRLALHHWTERELAGLARAVEPERPRRLLASIR